MSQHQRDRGHTDEAATRSQMWVRNFANLAAGEAFNSACRLGALVVVARRFGPSTFGLISTGTVIGAYVAIVAHSGLDIGGTTSIASNPANARNDIEDVVGLRLLIGFATYAVGLAVAFSVPMGGRTRLVILGFGLSVITLAADVRWAFVGLQKTRSVALASGIGGLWYLIGTLALARGRNWLLAFIAVHVSAELVASAVQWRAVRRLLGPWRPRRAARNRLRSLIIPAMPIAVTRSARTVVITLDVVFVRIFRSSAEAGQYALAGRVVAVGITYIGIYYHAYLAALSRARSENHGMSSLVHTAQQRALRYGLPMLAAALLLSPVGVKVVFGSTYTPAIGLLQAMLPSLLLLGFTGVHSQVLLAVAQQRKIAAIAVVATVVNIVTNVVLLPTIGTVGASIATVLAEAVTLVLSIQATRKLVHPPAAVPA